MMQTLSVTYIILAAYDMTDWEVDDQNLNF